MRDAKEKLTKKTIILHWLIALGMLSMVFMGWYMENYDVYSLYSVHKSIGVILLLFIFARVYWRWINGWPKSVSQQNAFTKTAARISHWVLLISTILFPISGMMMSGAGGHGVFVFGIQIMVKNIDPETGYSLPVSEPIADFGGELHSWLFWVVIVSVSIHILAALKHHFVDKDETLKRMIGR